MPKLDLDREQLLKARAFEIEESNKRIKENKKLKNRLARISARIKEFFS